MRQAGKALGCQIEDPLFAEVSQDRKGEGYIQAVRNSVKNEHMMVFVLLDYPDKKKFIKQVIDKTGIPSQFLLIPTASKGLSVFTNLLKQMNAKVQLDLYRIQLPKEMANTMQIGVDVCHEGKESIVGLSATYTAAMTQHFSKVYPQKLNTELIGKSKG